MEAKAFQELVDQLAGLTEVQRHALIEAVKSRASARDAVQLIDSRFAAAPRCPHCVSDDVGTWSNPKPLTRYMCRECDKTFTALTGTPLQHLRRRDAWLAYAQALTDGLSLRKAAKRCGIVLDTAFRWRHRFLELPKGKKATSMSGIVEVDETYLLKSQKGVEYLDQEVGIMGVPGYWRFPEAFIGARWAWTVSLVFDNTVILRKTVR